MTEITTPWKLCASNRQEELCRSCRSVAIDVWRGRERAERRRCPWTRTPRAIKNLNVCFRLYRWEYGTCILGYFRMPLRLLLEGYIYSNLVLFSTTFFKLRSVKFKNKKQCKLTRNWIMKGLFQSFFISIQNSTFSTAQCYLLIIGKYIHELELQTRSLQNVIKLIGIRIQNKSS